MGNHNITNNADIGLNCSFLKALAYNLSFICKLFFVLIFSYLFFKLIFCLKSDKICFDQSGFTVIVNIMKLLFHSTAISKAMFVFVQPVCTRDSG